MPPCVKGVMIWGAVSARGKSDLYILDKNETINQDKYIEIMNKNLKDWANTLYQDGF